MNRSMNTTALRQELHNYLEVADSKKLKAIYTMVEDDINIREPQTEYSAAFKAELNKRVNYYLNGGKMVTQAQMNKRLKEARNKIR